MGFNGSGSSDLEERCCEDNQPSASADTKEKTSKATGRFLVVDCCAVGKAWLHGREQHSYSTCGNQTLRCCKPFARCVEESESQTTEQQPMGSEGTDHERYTLNYPPKRDWRLRKAVLPRSKVSLANGGSFANTWHRGRLQPWPDPRRGNEPVEITLVVRCSPPSHRPGRAPQSPCRCTPPARREQEAG